MNRFLTISTMALLLCAAPASNASDKGKPFVKSDAPFVQISDPNRQAETWATCAAAYGLTSEITSELLPANSKQFTELANGAKLAVTMTLFKSGLTNDIDPERFNALWATSKLAGTELPKSKRTMLDATAELAPKDDPTAFMSDLIATVSTCNNNLKDQQAYIDAWRELAKSGLLQFPGE